MTESLFRFLTEVVWAEGGDGEAVVVLRHHNIFTVADAFEQWLKDNGYGERYRREGHGDGAFIVFTDQRNENIIFVDEDYKEQVKTSWRQDLWIEM